MKAMATSEPQVAAAATYSASFNLSHAKSMTTNPTVRAAD